MRRMPSARACRPRVSRRERAWRHDSARRRGSPAERPPAASTLSRMSSSGRARWPSPRRCTGAVARLAGSRPSDPRVVGLRRRRRPRRPLPVPEHGRVRHDARDEHHPRSDGGCGAAEVDPTAAREATAHRELAVWRAWRDVEARSATRRRSPPGRARSCRDAHEQRRDRLRGSTLGTAAQVYTDQRAARRTLYWTSNRLPDRCRSRHEDHSYEARQERCPVCHPDPPGTAPVRRS